MIQQASEGPSSTTLAEKLRRVRELISATGKLEGDVRGLWFERAALLVELFVDMDYRAKLEQRLNRSVEEDEVADALDEFCAGTGYDFRQLKLLVETFPQRRQWEEGSLAAMFDEARARSSRRQEREEPARRWSVTREQWERLERENAALKRQLKRLKDKLKAAEAGEPVAA